MQECIQQVIPISIRWNAMDTLHNMTLLDSDRGEKKWKYWNSTFGYRALTDPPKNCQHRRKRTRCMCNIHMKIHIHNFKTMWEVSSKINIGQMVSYQHHSWLKECHTDIHSPATLSSHEYSYCCVVTWHEIKHHHNTTFTAYTRI
jgi:hypothetical protein